MPVMSYTQAYTPHLPLHISRSPLLPSLGIANTEDDSLAALFMKRNLLSLCFDNKRKACTSMSVSSSSSSTTSPVTPVSGLHSLPYVDRKEKQLPSLPISAKQIISLLNLLERLDDDVADEVQRVKEGIKEAYVLVKEYREERRTKERERKKRYEREKKDTKQVDSDFWLGV